MSNTETNAADTVRTEKSTPWRESRLAKTSGTTRFFDPYLSAVNRLAHGPLVGESPVSDSALESSLLSQFSETLVKRVEEEHPGLPLAEKLAALRHYRDLSSVQAAQLRASAAQDSADAALCDFELKQSDLAIARDTYRDSARAKREAAKEVRTLSKRAGKVKVQRVSEAKLISIAGASNAGNINGIAMSL